MEIPWNSHLYMDKPPWLRDSRNPKIHGFPHPSPWPKLTSSIHQACRAQQGILLHRLGQTWRWKKTLAMRSVMSQKHPETSLWTYPLVICYKKLWLKSPCLIGKSTIKMVIFNSYVSLPEGNSCRKTKGKRGAFANFRKPSLGLEVWS